MEGPHLLDINYKVIVLKTKRPKATECGKIDPHTYVHLIYKGEHCIEARRVFIITNYQRNAKQNLKGTEACEYLYSKKKKKKRIWTLSSHMQKSIPGDSKT